MYGYMNDAWMFVNFKLSSTLHKKWSTMNKFQQFFVHCHRICFSLVLAVIILLWSHQAILVEESTSIGRRQRQIEHATICKALQIGHFSMNKEEFLVTSNITETLVSSDRECINHCIKRKALLASVCVDKLTCACGVAINPTVVEKIARTTTTNIGSLKGTEKIFLITEECEKADHGEYFFDDENSKTTTVNEDMKKHIFGCFLKTRTLLSYLLKYKQLVTMSHVTCFETCERKNSSIAITDFDSSCYCLDTKSLFCVTTGIRPIMCKLSERPLIGWRTWSTDSYCVARRFLESRRADLSGLISFPGSGNTWLRQMLEMATGIYTGSIYQDQDLYNRGFLGELLDWRSGKFLVVKDHIYLKERTSLNSYNSIILLIRNPYNALMAEFHRRTTTNHTGHANLSSFKEKGWSNYVVPMVDMWRDIISVVMKGTTPVKVVYYEDLLVNAEEEIQKIVNFLNFRPVDFKQRLFCIQTQKSTLFKRSPMLVEPFSSSLTNHINAVVKQVRLIMMKFGDESCRSLPPYERESQNLEASIRHGVAKSDGVAIKYARSLSHSSL